MIKLLAVLLTSMLIASCGLPLFVSPTSTPTPTFTPTPTVTQTPKPTYTLEVGVCLQFLRDLVGTANSNCTSVYKKPVAFVANQNSVTVSIDSSLLYPYCILYDQSRKIVAKNIASAGSTQITCTLP